MRRLVADADRLALARLVDLTLEREAKLLVLAGDIIDGWCRRYDVGLAFVHELLRLREVGARVAMVLGNHDARARMLGSLLLPEHVMVLGRKGVETQILDSLGVALHGWSNPEVSAPVDVAALFPPPVADLLNIGVLHTSAEGRRGHSDYAPCSRRTLRGHGFDYWALGHVHAREVVSTEPHVVFPGNLQGRGRREPGPKGATVVSVLAGRVLSPEHHPLDVLRFETLSINGDDARDLDEVLAIAERAVAGYRGSHDAPPTVLTVRCVGVDAYAAVLRVPTLGRLRALRAFARQVSSEMLWVDAIEFDGGELAGSFMTALAA
jgi:DNA repair protein SbcD/Mre11